ncbi:hypothetical protein E2C01_003964 [Portunus trituberculatus]|uniref:Uncharacterized protein n=1 Tax=Portunus trituberculatus TaxID=210409 RepID=A0A5B7CNM7_PORTR|nr:hypothetical protein [Portunus trituberculatus]
MERSNPLTANPKIHFASVFPRKKGTTKPHTEPSVVSIGSQALRHPGTLKLLAISVLFSEILCPEVSLELRGGFLIITPCSISVLKDRQTPTPPGLITTLQWNRKRHVEMEHEMMYDN